MGKVLGMWADDESLLLGSSAAKAGRTLFATRKGPGSASCGIKAILIKDGFFILLKWESKKKPANYKPFHKMMQLPQNLPSKHENPQNPHKFWKSKQNSFREFYAK